MSSADQDGGSANRFSLVKINWYFNVKCSTTLNTTINDKWYIYTHTRFTIFYKEKKYFQKSCWLLKNNQPVQKTNKKKHTQKTCKTHSSSPRPAWTTTSRKSNCLSFAWHVQGTTRGPKSTSRVLAVRRIPSSKFAGDRSTRGPQLLTLNVKGKQLWGQVIFRALNLDNFCGFGTQHSI